MIFTKGKIFLGAILCANFTIFVIYSDKLFVNYHWNILKWSNSCNNNVVPKWTELERRTTQDERKTKINEVCEMCRRNQSSMECHHVAMGPKGKMYGQFLVNEKHKVDIHLFLTT